MKLRYPLTIVYLLNGASNAFIPSPSSARGTISKLHSATAVADEIAVATDTAASPGTAAAPDNSDPRIPPSPGLNENALFQCDPSVEFWRDFYSDGTAQENLQEIANIATRFAALGPDGWRYWIRHAGRSGYFMGNAALGTLGGQLHKRLVSNDDDAGSGQLQLPININSSVATRLVLEAFLCYEQDYAKVKEGQYREPWDMKLNHRQSSPINILTQTGRFVNEAIGILARRNRQRDEDKNIWITDPATSSLYPEYYQTAFHYQTDGWMSKRSADVYETSTETLFLGRQDAMQRTSLPPIVQLSKNRSSKEGPMKILEIACGTGRFMSSIRDNLPLDTECTAVDLSPYYLDAARDNDAYWRKTRREEENRNGNSIGKDDIKPLRLIQAQAENLPFDDESFDAVVCVYLYHELPRYVRAMASSEMSRVLKKGGVLVLTDSIQIGDRPALENKMGDFGKMNEPFYLDYIQDDLSEHFVKEGLNPVEKTVRSTTKSLSFTK